MIDLNEPFEPSRRSRTHGGQLEQRFKADAGKPRPALLQIGMQRALRLVQATLEYGAIKYEEHSWRNVPEGAKRYLEAAERHRQERLLVHKDNQVLSLKALDSESNLPHIAHEIVCLLMLIELELDAEPYKDLLKLCEFHQPPLDHKK
jgi:hypothetical protein